MLMPAGMLLVLTVVSDLAAVLRLLGLPILPHVLTAT